MIQRIQDIVEILKKARAELEEATDALEAARDALCDIEFEKILKKQGANKNEKLLRK